MYLYDVKYREQWEGDTDSSVGNFGFTVVAPDAEAAIAKVRKKVIGRKEPQLDDEGKQVKGKFWKVTGIVVESVTQIRYIDLT